MVRDNRHVSTYIFGAICPDRGVGSAMIMPYANTEAMNAHLEEISAEVAPGAHAVLVCDGAGWHQRGEKLTVPGNITLLPLPPYSPELNPMENVWDYLRQNKLCALVWNTYEEILDACQSAWRFLIDDPDRIRSIGNPPMGGVSTFRGTGIRWRSVCVVKLGHASLPGDVFDELCSSSHREIGWWRLRSDSRQEHRTRSRVYGATLTKICDERRPRVSRVADDPGSAALARFGSATVIRRRATSEISATPKAHQFFATSNAP